MLERSYKFAANYRPFSSFSTLFYPAEACFFPDLFLAARPARLMQAARAATRAQPTRPETEVPAALSLPDYNFAGSRDVFSCTADAFSAAALSAP